MFINDEQILQELRKQSTDYFIKTIKDMLVFWIEEACLDRISSFPVLYISLTFKNFNEDDVSLIFTSNSPIILNENGSLRESCFNHIQEILEEDPYTLSYVYCYQVGSDLHICYEDVKGLIDYKLNFNVEEDGSLVFLQEEMIENPIRFKFLEKFFKDEKMQ